MQQTNKFINALKSEESAESVSVTENGAVGYKNTRSKLLDFFFGIGSMRNKSDDDIATAFSEAYAENPRRAIELMFFARDCRGGMGEKRVFNVCFKWLIANFPGDAIDVLSLIPEYGSWKTIFELTEALHGTNVENYANVLVRERLMFDLTSEENGGSISLMAKWLPSENTSSKATRKLAKYWRNVLQLSPKGYRKTLSKLRSKLNVVETDMSAGRWSEIDYNKVPSKAGMLYREAFLKHDASRREAWLSALKNGKSDVKINTNSLTVPEMIHAYRMSGMRKEDETIEAAWREIVRKGMLPEGTIGILPIIDGSGSMSTPISASSNVEAIDVSMGLGLYLANVNTGFWRGHAIEFGSNPELFAVPTGSSLLAQLKIAIKHNDCGSTNVKGVFDLILNAAKKYNLKQEDIPHTICTFSDMEFDEAYNNPYTWDAARGYVTRSQTERSDVLFVKIAKEYEDNGYSLPKMVFWNINSRTGTIPLTENDNGVVLVSGYSQSIMSMVCTNKLDPYDAMIEQLDAKRYDPVREALNK